MWRENNSISFSPAAAKSLQSCLTVCDPTDGSPPGSAIPGILQARILEWVAISFSTFSPDSPLKQILSSFTSLVTQMVKYLPAMQETPGSIPGSGKSPGEGNCNPLQYSGLENSLARGAMEGFSLWDHRVGFD